MAPVAVPSAADFNARVTLKELKSILPARLFERSLPRALRHLFVDLLHVAFFIVLQMTIVDRLLLAQDDEEGEAAVQGSSSPPMMSVQLLAMRSLGVVAMLLTIFAQGVCMTGVWVLAHEMGHGGFSPNQTVNDILGFLCHTPLLVPYFSWQKSHANHHAWTGHLDNDEVWVPQTVIEDAAKVKDVQHMNANYGRKSTVRTLIELLSMATVGWPLYILINASGHRPHNVNDTLSHFDADSPIFKGFPKWKVNLSTAGILVWLCAVGAMIHHFGFWVMLRVYILPVIVTMFFLTSVTFLQHTDENIPFWVEGEWNWLRGAILTTQDRSMGWWIDKRTHHIATSHVCHHVFSKMPFWHAEEATALLRDYLGPYYNKNGSTSFYGYCRDLFNNFANSNAMVRRPDHHVGHYWYIEGKSVKAE